MPRIFLILGVLGLANAYVAWRWRGRLPKWSVVPFFLLQIVGPFGDRLWFSPWRGVGTIGSFVTALDWVSYLALGLLSFLVLYGLVMDGVHLALRADGPDHRRRAFLTLGLATAGSTVVGVHQAMAGPNVVAVDVPLKRLPRAFDGLTIAQISDIHVGPLIDRAYVEDVVTKVKALNADIIVWTGDFIDGEPNNLRADLAPLGTLHAPMGIYYSPGNHEYYWGLERWLPEFERLGATVLLNDHRVLERGGEKLVIAGLADWAADRFEALDGPDLKTALAGAPDAATIVLAHQPKSYEILAGGNVDLQLSGHTHAGQYFPFSLVVALAQRYVQGLYRHGDLTLYVNRGTGFWGPPLRTANASEITLLTLRQLS